MSSQLCRPVPVSWILGITDVNALFSHVADLGFSGVQFAGGPRDYRAADVARAAERHSLTIVAVDPFNCGPPDPSRDGKDEAIDYFKTVADFAVACGAPAITLQGLTQWTANARDKQEAHSQLVHCVNAICDYAGGRGLATWFEPCNHYESPLIHNVSEYRELIEIAGDPPLGLVFDTFHMNIGEPQPRRALAGCADCLVSYQISDSNRSGIGCGHIDFAADCTTLKSLGFEGPVAVEIGLPELVPHTPPRTLYQARELDAQLQTTHDRWRALCESLNAT